MGAHLHGYKNRLFRRPHKTHVHVKGNKKKKKSGPQHPFDKWIAVRGKIAEAAIERKALIKAIADFIKTVLPDITLIPLVTPKRDSVEYGPQTAPPPPTRVVPLPSTSSVGDEVYEAETSHVSARFAGPPAPTVVSDDDDDGETGAISEGDVHAFARKSFGVIASPYLSSYVQTWCSRYSLRPA
jgi:hypothetical protein